MTSTTSSTDRPPPSNGVVPSRDGTPISFTVTGAGPCVVLVEPVGHFRDVSAFDGVAELLADRFSVITYDRRGRGASTTMASPYSPQREVEDLAAIIDVAAGGSAFVYGYSSGALVALHAAAAAVAIDGLAVLEPPLHDQDAMLPDPLTSRLVELVAAGRHDDVVLEFHESIGVPSEFIDQMRITPQWAAMVGIAPTFVHDCIISDATITDVLAAVHVPTLVLDSEASTDDLTGSAAQVAARLPNTTHRSLPGEWHTVDDDILAAALLDHFTPTVDTNTGEVT